jgi:ribonuclease P protein component
VEEEYYKEGDAKEELDYPLCCRVISKENKLLKSNQEIYNKEKRILKRSEFVRVQKRGKRYKTRSLLILIHPGQTGQKRLGIAASKKIGNSVKRNRIKRLIREVFRKNQNLFPDSADIVIIPKIVNHKIEYFGLVEEIEDFWRRYQS